MTTFVFIDTNLYIRFISQGKPGCESTFWDDLVRRIKAGSVTLIVPEIVALEVEKQWRAISEDIAIKLLKARNHLKTTLDSQITGTELEEFPTIVLQSYDELRSRKSSEMKERNQQVLQMFSLPQVKHIEFSPEIWFRSKKRQVAGRIGRLEGQSEKDCCIIESLLGFFSSSSIEETQLLFCSENHKDFGLNLTFQELKSKDELLTLKEDKRNLKSDEWILHPIVSNGLPSSRYFLDLGMLIDFVKQDKRVVPPTPDIVQKAVEREEEEGIQQRAGEVLQLVGDGLISPIVQIRSLIQSHFNRFHSKQIGRYIASKIERISVEFEQARIVYIDEATPFVEELWECFLEIRNAVRMLSAFDNSLSLFGLAEQENLIKACNRFMRLSADWIDMYREENEGYHPR